MSVQDNSGVSGLGASHPEPSAERREDVRAIGALLGQLEKAWNEHAGDAYAAGFTEQSDYIAFDGTHLRGREANARHHQALFDSVLRGSRLVFEGEPMVRFIAADVAVVHSMGSVLLPWQAEVTAKRRSNQTLVAVKTEHGWRFTAFHNTRYRPYPLPKGVLLTLIVAFMRLRTALFGKSQHAETPSTKADALVHSRELEAQTWS